LYDFRSSRSFCLENPVGLAVADALGTSIGFLFALFTLGSVREILGNGSLFGVSLFGSHFEPWVIMLLPPGGFIMLGLILLFFNWINEKRENAIAQLATTERNVI